MCHNDRRTVVHSNVVVFYAMKEPQPRLRIIGVCVNNHDNEMCAAVEPCGTHFLDWMKTYKRRLSYLSLPDGPLAALAERHGVTSFGERPLTESERMATTEPKVQSTTNDSSQRG